MDSRTNILNAFTAYREATGLAFATISTKATNDGKFYDSILNGAGFTMQRYEKIMQWFQENTPQTVNTKRPN